MQIEVQDPVFSTRQLAVETAGIFSGPKLLLNGVPVEKLKGVYSVAIAGRVADAIRPRHQAKRVCFERFRREAMTGAERC